MIIPFKKGCANEDLLKKKNRYALRKAFEDLKIKFNESPQTCKCDEIKNKIRDIESIIDGVL